MRSLNGKFHRQSEDKMIKVYDKGVTFEQVSKERDLAKKALVMGVPTLIPFDVCMVEDRFGLMFEASDTYPLSRALALEPHLLKRYATDFIVDQAYFADSRREGSGDTFEMPSMNDTSDFVTVDDSEELPF